ncbi:MAG TPA: sensor histidine kinase [Chitinophagaceae bacterium]
MNRILIFCILLFLYPLLLPAQKNTDSLRSIVLSQKDPAKKAAALILLCEQFRFTNPDSLLAAATELYTLGQQHNNKTWQVTADFFSATYYNLSGRADTALTIAERNIQLIKDEKKETALLIKLYSLAGNSLMRLNRQKDALQMFYACLQYAETNNDTDAQLKAQNNIGWAYMELEQHEKAITYFKSCLNTIRQHALPDRYGTIYNNMASCYGSLGSYDSVYKYASTGIQIAGKYDDYAALANGHSIMGTFQVKQNKYEEALSSFKKAVAIREKIGDPFFIVSDLAEISELQSKTGNTTEGISNGKKALAMATENNIDAKLPMIYIALAHNYEQAGNYQEAAASYKILNTLKDSLYNDANPKALAEIQAKYETVKKEQQIEHQQNRIRLQNYLFIGIAGLALLIGLLLYSLYKRYRLKKESQLQSAIMKQQQLSVKAVMEAEENERSRIAKDLHDGVGQMMSAAKMNLSAFESGIKFDTAEQQHSFEKAIQLVDESCKEVRTVSHIMMPNALLKNNLAAAIHEFVDKLDKKSLQVHVYTEGIDERLDSNIEIVLYRVLQECVNNVIKHAGATTLDISVIKGSDGIDATIEDNGKGFDTANKEKSEGMGLKNIITRIQYLKGIVDFDAAPGRGTVVALHVPV